MKIIAGPCSIESEKLTFETFRKLSENENVNMLRGGIWKPRTKPNSFEGIGEIGLQWMIEAAKEVGLPPITEVANTDHVEKALKAGFKHLWIGARTTVNPFTVQEIADALQGANDVSIWIKNPINPDLKLWLGGIERVQGAGLQKVAAIHRGFSIYGETKYRNSPIWNIPLKLKTEFPEMELICDPSHICGRIELIPQVSQEALDLNFDGLMIETHMDRSIALSDANQQLSPTELDMMIINLSLKIEKSDCEEVNEQLQNFRDQIENLDEQLINLLANRSHLSKQIGAIKNTNNIALYQQNQWLSTLTKRIEYAESKGLRAGFIEQILDLLHEESINIQKPE